MVYRRFGLVFSRLLLNKQDEIREMEATLLAMDRTDQANGDRTDQANGNRTDQANSNYVYLMSRTEDVNRNDESVPSLWSETRTQLLERLEKKTLEYGGSIITSIENPFNET